MANSSFIGKIKKKIIKEFIRDNDIVQAINSNTITSPEKLVGTHIFNYHQNPYTIENVGTFITIQIHIPQDFHSYNNSQGKAFVKPTIEIWIISHEQHMIVDNIPKITENRNDYLSELIDKKLNGKSNYGITDLTLISNIEGCYQQDYLFRKMIFEGIDLNNTLCDDE